MVLPTGQSEALIAAVLVRNYGERRACIGADAYMRIMVNSVLPATARPHRPPPILICRKCLKRAANGRAIKRAL
jgi:hypothetical protein